MGRVLNAARSANPGARSSADADTTTSAGELGAMAAPAGAPAGAPATAELGALLIPLLAPMKASCLALAITWCAAAPAAAQELPGPLGKVRALLAADVDGDRDVDLLVLLEGAPPCLYRNDGSGAFTAAPDDHMPPAPLDARHGALADLDRDGRLDLVVACTPGESRIYRGSAGGRFVDIGDPLLPPASCVAIGDVDGDRRPDLVLGTVGRPPALLLAQQPGAAGKAATAAEPGGAPAPAKALRFVPSPDRLPDRSTITHAVLLGDVDADGDLDLLLGNHPNAAKRGGGDRLYRNDGKGRFTDESAQLMPSGTAWTRQMVLADLDGDGDLDLVAANSGPSGGSGGRSTVHVWQDKFLFGSAERLPIGVQQACGVACADVDGDGDVDLVFAISGRNRLFVNAGDCRFADAPDAMPPEADDTRAVVLADVDGDGDQDLVVGNDGAACRVHRNEGGRFLAAAPAIVEPVAGGGERAAAGGGGAGGGGDRGGGGERGAEAGGDEEPFANVPAADVPQPDLTKLADGKYAPRRSGRKQLRSRGAQQAIELGMQWLRRHQDGNGRWDSDRFMKHDEEGTPLDGAGDSAHDVGLTGLALLVFLAEGSTHLHGDDAARVHKGVTWLREQQQKNGVLGSEATQHFIYDHAIATLALTEAYGLSGDPALRAPVELAVGYLEQHRNPAAGWRYGRQEASTDASITAWCLAALVTAGDFGVPVSDAALRSPHVWLESVTDEEGRCGYIDRGGRSARHAGRSQSDFPTERTEAMTAAALFVRRLLGDGLNQNPELGKGRDLIAAQPPRWHGRAGDFYYWFYGALAMRHCDSRSWTAWQKPLNDTLTAGQRKGGRMEGSWDPNDPWGEDGGRIYATALAVLSLQAEYRYATLPARSRRR